MKRLPFFLILMFLVPMDGHAAGPFSKGRLFVSPSMKTDLGRFVGVGMTFTVAPVRMAQKTLLDQFEKDHPKDYETMLEVAQYVDAEDLSGSDPKAQLMAIPQLSPEQKSAIEDLPIDDSDSQLVLDVVNIMKNPSTAVTFSMEPFVELHFDAMDLTFTVPIAGFDGHSVDFAMGNVGIDMRFGHHFGTGIVGGLSYGVQVWAPTGTGKANALGLANLMWSTRYFHEYVTAAPYLILGLELPMLTIQASCLYNAMFGVRDSPDFDQVQYIQYGGAVSLDLFVLTLVAEISGLSGIQNAQAYNSLVSTVGLRFTSSVLDLGLAGQFPIIQESGSSFASFSSVSFGNPSDFNVMLTGSIGL